MTQRVLGPTGSPRRRWTMLVPLTLAIVLGLFYIAGAQGVHTNTVFELDRNAYQDAAAKEDWQNVCPASTDDGIAGGVPNDTCVGGDSADASSFTTDGAGATIFTGGSSKDIDAIGDWLHKDGSVSPKSNLLHGYAARYDDLLFFGADRFATQGTTTLGVWFLQGDVAPITSGANAGKFSGGHVDGDILVLADFQASGANASVRVFEWQGDDATGSPVLIGGAATSPADCVAPAHPSTGAGSEFCATANLVNTSSPWAFQAQGPQSPANTFLPGLFFEGGLDLAALDLDEGCFSTFLVETRSSNELTAVLEDFVTGQLESCTSGTVTTPSAGSNGTVFPGASVTDTAVITVGGTSTFGGTVSFFLCGPTPLSDASYTLCTTGGTEVNGSGASALNPPRPVTGVNGTATVISSAVTLNAVGRYCWRAVYSGDSNVGVPSSSDSSVTECFRVIQLQPSMTTAQSFVPNDSATISVTGADNLAGHVHFTLYPSANCSGTALWTQEVAVSGASPQTVNTTNSTPITTTQANLSWQVDYHSTFSGHNNITSCGETASLTITNGGTFNTP